MSAHGSDAEREALAAQVAAAIDGPLDAARRDVLLGEVAAWQARHVEPFGRLCAARRARFDRGPDGWPALPTDVFRHARVAAHPPEADRAVFRTSGTTSGRQGEHPLRDLALYDRAARAAALHALFAEGPLPLAIVAPHPSEAPSSSLSYMLGRFEVWLGRGAAWCWRDGDVDLGAFLACTGAPVAVLGASFALARLDERLDRDLSLSAGSLVMQTGGFKGRSREIEPAAFRAALCRRLGVPEARIVSEYGMTELCSQLYGRGLLDGSIGEEERLWVPPWVRATPVDPETLAPVGEGELGLLRLDDLANLDTACSVQTSDLARRRGESIVLLGRAPGAVPRGCSLAIEEALA